MVPVKQTECGLAKCKTGQSNVISRLLWGLKAPIGPLCRLSSFLGRVMKGQLKDGPGWAMVRTCLVQVALIVYRVKAASLPCRS